MPDQTPGDPAVVDDLAGVVDRLGGYRRENQEEMARLVMDAFTEGEVLVVQAGTGTGKSLGYLVPAARALRDGAGRVVIATATLALQRQLITGDIPALMEGLGPDTKLSAAVLKGRGNYLCRARLETGPEPGEELPIAVQRGALEEQADRLRDWAEQTDTGDRDDYPGSVDGRVWRAMSATGRECVGPSRCAFADSCFSEQSRRTAGQADIVVTNHALLALHAFEDRAVLPEHDLLVVDEAHEFTGRATAAATAELTVGACERAAQSARSLLGDDARSHLAGAIDALGSVLNAVGRQDVRLTELPIGLVEPLASLRDALHVAITEVTGSQDTEAATRHRVAADLGLLHDVAGRILAWSDQDVIWCSGGLHVAPLSVAAGTRGMLSGPKSAVMTSATLTIGGDFSAFAGDCGLGGGSPKWSAVDVGSPFDYSSQGILYIATDLPRPTRDGSTHATTERILDLLVAAGGRSLVLMSSWRGVDRAVDQLREGLPDGINLLVQQRGEPVGRLVGLFATDPKSVLLGTMSLFQGVDVPGPACQCVIIERIPFPRPDDPVLAARSQQVDDGGGSGFMSVSVPRAALLLAQGSGRLIRSKQDRGVVAVLDPRLGTARYGSYLLNSLPPFWRTTDHGVARAALERLNRSAESPVTPAASP